MKRLFLLVVSLLLTIQGAFCQTLLEGLLVKDDTLQVPIPEAIITLKGTTIGTVTNESGYFKLVVPDSVALMFPEGNFTILIRTIGYEPQQAVIRPVSHDEALTLTLTESSIKVEYLPVVVNGAVRPPRYAVSTVYFATDRNRTTSANPTQMFGVNRSNTVYYGHCRVSIPRDHRMGEMESPNIWRLEVQSDPEKHITLLSARLRPKEAFFRMLRDSLSQFPTKQAFIFIHGYNVNFTDAARRTAQMSYDLGFKGTPIFYSWPSKASTLQYTVDEATIEWTQRHLKVFLKDFLTNTNADKVYIIAHSMGNRAMTRAVASLIQEQPILSKKISEIILAAPDIDADVFVQDIAPRLTSKKHPVTLYASSTDLALQASKVVHGAPRAGDSGSEIVITAGVESIDATGTDTGFLQHSYIGDSRTVIGDILELMAGKRASEREKLNRRSKAPNKHFWEFKQ